MFESYKKIIIDNRFIWITSFLSSDSKTPDILYLIRARKQNYLDLYCKFDSEHPLTLRGNQFIHRGTTAAGVGEIAIES